MAKLLATLNAQVWQNQLRRQFSSRRGNLVLPRFNLEYGANLKQPLTALGMTLPFSRGADFSGMSATSATDSPRNYSEEPHRPWTILV